MAAEGEDESESDDESTEHDSHFEVQNISDDELGLDATAGGAAGDGVDDRAQAPKTLRPDTAKMPSNHSSQQVGVGPACGAHANKMPATSADDRFPPYTHATVR